MPNQKQAKAQGEFATEAVVDEYDLIKDNATADWFDARAPSGARYEVKSTTVKIGDDDRPGRFRLWKDQHESLQGYRSQGTAWYAFVLLDDGRVVDIQRRKPQTVTKAVEKVGGGEWNEANHHDRYSQQKKVPWPLLVDA
jgi:hypothetical protein